MQVLCNNCCYINIDYIIVCNCVLILNESTCIPIASQSPSDLMSSVLSVEHCNVSVPHHTGSIMNVAVLEIIALSHFDIAPLVLSKSLMQLMETPAICFLV